ncbi:DUF1361 domain-containing protein [Pediococcus ethanolidurans]|uniref:DUF1361 domain-containing protein n=1 Tax=Pediococcus ethanolidurans TaxID=319653 RepID=UPI001C1EBDBD|nr:DUF1361 domain-containing protein [Pediococcus ethanolidurans]MBU7555549.1 DUF1361 domain-containing protein [Pediococcus ethanolidurans]MBU7562762.1 DUF1361 domain-containing protein [Pediococcus ethanolidurans]MCT4398233.1 DUF1361 domain-containing protein [Pediococcus ethanolidurans]MCV3315341.1 DUF1361 domain-containing protein [Pediococcus ethanolidurans]MCV3321419.1 DUF1361 domain-containing protein [Pediococcus ethanolidurans]
MTTKTKWIIRLCYGLGLLYIALFVHPPYHFLLLNTFLAYIPIEIAFHVGEKRPKNSLVFWLTILVWLLFYPNAPYLLTDLFHLSLLHPYGNTGLIRLSISMWIYYIYMLLAVIPSVMLGMWSMTQVTRSIVKRYHIHHKIIEMVIVGIFTTLSSIGIFIGRFLRLHTIYLLISPEWVLKPIFNMWSLQMLAFVILMTLLQSTIYVVLRVIRNTN